MDSQQYSLPRLRFVRWLLDSGQDVPPGIRSALIASLFGTLPIFAGGVANTIALAAVAYARRPEPLFAIWLALEVVLGIVRVLVLWRARIRANQSRATFTDSYIVLALFWSAGVGYGACISLLSGDWVIAAMSCLSAAAMAGGICFRNFGAPRLAVTMMTLSMAPIAIAGALSGQPIFLLALLQIPFYLISMGIAAHKLNGMLVSTMRAERENDHRASHDALTGLRNRAGIAAALTRPGPFGVRALLYIDLDGFKQVNDSYGHAAGDMLLGLLARRLQQAVHPGDVVGRVGGDEFVIVAEGVTRDNAIAYSRMVITSLSAPYELAHGETATVGASAGIALLPEHGTEFAELMARADAALYKAKGQGRSCSCIAEP